MAMLRTQISLGDDERVVLDRLSRSSGKSMSELIRDAVRRAYGEPTQADRIREALAKHPPLRADEAAAANAEWAASQERSRQASAEKWAHLERVRDGLE